ncbi:MAG: nickel-dependent hydrogenase large subunit [Pseudomonadota bacterium]|nr:nickel-dependent hydrogenase large subunit [Pseudomonadota bacterium]
MNTVVVDPVTRIEGHLRIEAELDDNGTISRASSSGTMIRGIEMIMQGRDPRDAWAFTQRICGVCTTSHGIASVRAVEDALHYQIPQNAEIIRNLMNGAQYVQDHVVHFYHLHAMDWVDVVSALDADPATTAEAQTCISSWPNNSTEYFTAVQDKLRTFVESGQLGIFTNGYWGHPEYKLPPEINLLAFAHYLEALAWQREVAKVHAIFGGKNPHPSFVVGGMPSAISTQGEVTAVNGETLAQVGSIISEMRTFVDQVYLPDFMAIARFYKDWAGKGEGLGNFLSFGDFPQYDVSDETGFFFPRGAILNRDLSTIHPVDLNDPLQVQELISHAWYDYSVGKHTPLHPYDGETDPRYTGPPLPYDHLDLDAEYSWLKSPRWRGQPMEVGPLARVLIMYAQGNEAITESVNRTLAELKLPLTALFSTLGRTAARGIECKALADQMELWYRDLLDNIAAGDVSVFNDALFDPATWPADARGVGFLEAPRGALAHWVVIRDGLIDNYQAVVPTTWNAGPRDNDGREGPYDAALRGHHLHDPTQPLEILRTIHSFDPCMGCAVHLSDPNHSDLLTIKLP